MVGYFLGHQNHDDVDERILNFSGLPEIFCGV
jgi:hypothetical protein